MYKSTRNELLRDSNIELYTENNELKSEIRYLQEELEHANGVLDNIETILKSYLDGELADTIYKEIFDL